MLVGAQQGALIVLLSSLPLVVEAALRGRVSTEVELTDARNTWVAVEGFIGVEPAVQGTYTDVAFLCQAVRPEGIRAAAQTAARSLGGPNAGPAAVRVLLERSRRGFGVLASA